MTKVKTTWSQVSKIATQFLAIAGVASIIYASFDYLENLPEKLGKKVTSYDAYVRPICEDLAGKTLKYRDGSIAEAKLIGVQITTTNDVSGLIIRFRDIAWVQTWRITTSGFTEEEANKVIRSFPEGDTIDKAIFISVPRLIADSKTTIELEGIVSQKFECVDDWFQASAPNRNIAHLIKPDFHPIREWSLKSDSFNVYKYLFIASSIAFVIALIKKRKATKKKTKRPIRSERTPKEE